MVNILQAGLKKNLIPGTHREVIQSKLQLHDKK
jgi:hypothetical protein